MKNYILLFLLLFYSVTNAQNLPKITFSNQVSATESSLRGLCVVSPKIVWASGSKGTVLFTQDGGDTWKSIKIKDFEDKDFRDIHAFDDKSVLVMNAGSPAYILRSENGGNSWEKVYENNDETAFLDDFAFKDTQNGLAFGDPDANGKFLALQTKDGGKTWIQNNDFFPVPIKGEGGFAASGSILQYAEKLIVLATGGGEKSRIFYSEDEGKNWTIQETPITSGTSPQGIFSIAISKNNREWVAVGGDYSKPEETGRNIVYTNDKGNKWEVAGENPVGYRSGVAFLRDQLYVCVGTTGANISPNAGKNWFVISKENLNAIRFSADKKTGWVVGGKGIIMKLTIE